MPSNEYDVIRHGKDGTIPGHSPTTNDPKQAGAIYREWKKDLPPGSTVELRKREVGDWQTVEKTEA